MRLSATAVVIVMAWSTVAAADPRLLPPDADVQGRLTASSDRLPDGAAYDCYAIETEPGQQVTVTMRSQAFDSRLWVARGGQCASARLQHDNDDFEGRDARVSFTTVGGRYLILARTKGVDGTGAYRLSLKGGAPMQVAAVAAPPGEDERLALMNRQTRQLEAQRAAEAARQAAVAEQRRLAELEQREQERRDREARASQGAAMFNALVGGLQQGLNQANNAYSQQQSFLADVNHQAQQIARQREAAERAQQRAQEAEQAQRNAQQQQGAQALARQLAEANAYRERQMAQTTDPAERQRLAADNASALQAARQVGVEGEVRNQTQAIMAGRQTSAMQGQADAQQQQRDQAEADRRAAEQRQIQQAEQRRLAEQARQVEQQRQAEQQRAQLQAEQRRQEEQRQAAARQAEEEARRRAANTPPAYASPPAIGRLGADWSQWFTFATHNGVTISWRARVSDRETLRVQWQCANRSDERRYCSISDKTYRCFAGSAPAGQGQGSGDASDVAAGREYQFVSEPGCTGTGLTFLLPQASVSATPT